jgi:branched-chain amino acid transport system substrate-binding protein
MVRSALLGALAAALSTACALLIDLPSSVTYAPDDGAAANQPDGNPSLSGLCPHPIRVRSLNATTSAAVADVALPIYLGALDSLREINEQGGIRGCPIDYQFRQVIFGDSASAVSAYEAFKAEPDWPEVSVVFGVGSADTIALGPKVQEDKRVLFSLAYNGTYASPVQKRTPVAVPETSPTFVESVLETQIDTIGYPYVFFPGVDYSTAIRVAMYHLSTIEPGVRIGFVHCPSNEFCTNPLPAGKSYAAQNGLLIGRSMFIELTERDPTRYGQIVTQYFVEEATREGAISGYKPVSWLWAGNLTGSTFLLAAALGQQGNPLTPNPTTASPATWQRAQELMRGVKIIANNYGFDESIIGLCARLGPGAVTCGRIFGIQPFLPFGDQSAGSTEMPALVALHDKWRARDVGMEHIDPAVLDGGAPPPTRSIRYVQGYLNVKLLRAAVERVFDAKKQVTGETLKEALESLRSFDTGGLTAPLTFTPDDHRPQSTLSIYQYAPPEGDAGTDGGDAGPPLGGLVLVSANRRIALQQQWLGW